MSRIHTRWNEGKSTEGSSGALQRRLRELRDAADPKGWRVSKLRTEVKQAVARDNEDKFYRNAGNMVGVDRYGKPFAAPAASTVKGWERKGLVRQILAPHGLASQTITHFRVVWRLIAGNVWYMVAGWEGLPWMIYHLKGAPKGSKGVDRLGRDMSHWSLPRRDAGGVTPKGWVEVRGCFTRFWASVRRKAG